MSGPARRTGAAPTRTVAIVPLFDGEALVESCLEALLAGNDDELRVVLVDDGSRDAGVERAREVASRSGGRVHVLARRSNGGFAAAINHGAAWALAQPQAPDLLVFVNQDCVVSGGWLAPLREALADPAIAVAGARLLEADGVTLQHAGARIAANGLTSHLGRGCRDPLAWRERVDADYVCGALFAMRSTTWRRLGPFDEGYAPAYYEEVDFCLRARREGGRVVMVPGSQAVHREAACSGAGSRLYLRRYHRSRLRFVVRRLLAEVGARRWFCAEANWLLTLRRWNEIAPVLAAYARLPLFAAEIAREAVGERPRESVVAGGSRESVVARGKP